MIGPNDKRPHADYLRKYQEVVAQLYPDHIRDWPLLNGWNELHASYNGSRIVVFKDSPHSGHTAANGVGEIDKIVIGYDKIDKSNKEIIRENLSKHFKIQNNDVVLIFENQFMDVVEMNAMIERHSVALGLSAMKIFLSHKGCDKPEIRKYCNSLKLLGFSPWLDETEMAAGANLNRDILKGFQNSCAAIFFITESFADENFLAAEIDYAIAEKQKRGDSFSIITLVFNTSVNKCKVPDLLQRYVWKEPKSQLEALDEILRALPIKTGPISWKN